MPYPAINNPYGKYQKTAIETAPPSQLLLILYDGAIKFARQAKKAIEDRNYETAHEFLIKTEDILWELENTLDLTTGEVAYNLKSLYGFYREELIRANIEKNAIRVEPVIEFLKEFRNVWEEAARSLRIKEGEQRAGA